MAAADRNQHPVLVALLAAQQSVQAGAPGGLGEALAPEARALALTHAARFKPVDVRDPCSVAPDAPDAHDIINRHITILVDKLVAAKWFLLELEAVALDWLASQFKGRAADHWYRVVREARVTATTTGIGPNSVLYRCLRDMLLAYPATGIKAALLRRKAADLPWKPKATVEQIQSITIAYYEAYDRAVALTRGNEVTSVVPAQDWPTRFTEMQQYFPDWAVKLVIDYPARFTSMAACWTALVADASRQAAGRTMGSGGRLLQLAEVTAGDLDGTNAARMSSFGGVGGGGGGGAGPPRYGNYYDFYASDESLPELDSGIFAMSRIPGCWRCGAPDHHRKHCPQRATQAELDGAPINQWAKMPSRPLPYSSRGVGAVLGPVPSRIIPPQPTSVAQVAEYATKADIENILARLDTLTQTPALSQTPAFSTPASFPVTGAAASIAQMATAAPASPSPRPLIVGGLQPEGYLYVGTNHGQPLWGHESTVAASLMDTGVAGNEVGM